MATKSKNLVIKQAIWQIIRLAEKNQSTLQAIVRKPANLSDNAQAAFIYAIRDNNLTIVVVDVSQ